MPQFNDTTNLTGLIQDCEDILDMTSGNISGTAALLKRFTKDINEGYGIVAEIIARADGRMKWDDPNHSNLPTATFNLVSGQTQYSIFSSAPTALQDWLIVERVEILDTNDNGVLLTPVDRRNTDVDWDEFNETNGTPVYYDIKGDSLFLKPATNYAKTNGGTIYFEREPSFFAYTDTTKRPGFATRFHCFLSKYASRKYAQSKEMWNTVKTLDNDLNVLEKRIADFYKNRAKFDKLRIIPLKKSYK
jgi:hypothetical protein